MQISRLMVVSRLYVRQANVKIILELTGNRCNSDRRAVAGSCKRLGKTMHVFVCYRTALIDCQAAVYH